MDAGAPLASLTAEGRSQRKDERSLVRGGLGHQRAGPRPAATPCRQSQPLATLLGGSPQGGPAQGHCHRTWRKPEAAAGRSPGRRHSAATVSVCGGSCRIRDSLLGRRG